MKLKLKLPDFGIHKSHCINKNNYGENSKFSNYNIFCQKLNRHPLKLNTIDNRITIIPIQTDNIAPKERYLSGTPTGNPGVHKINDEDSIQILGPSLVYTVKNEADLKIIEEFVNSPHFYVNDTSVLNAMMNLRNFNFNSHLENNKRSEVHVFELNGLIERHAIPKINKQSEQQQISVINSTLKPSKNVVHKHTELLYNKQYEDHKDIKTATLLSETTQNFYCNPGDRYLTKEIKKMGEEQEKILTVTLKTHQFKSESEFQKYYELKKSATNIKNLIERDSDLD